RFAQTQFPLTEIKRTGAFRTEGLYGENHWHWVSGHRKGLWRISSSKCFISAPRRNAQCHEQVPRHDVRRLARNPLTYVNADRPSWQRVPLAKRGARMASGVHFIGTRWATTNETFPHN